MEKLPLVGPFVLDSLIFGLGDKGFFACGIEINGLIHDTEKGSKDAFMEKTLHEFGIRIVPVSDLYVMGGHGFDPRSEYESSYLDKVLDNLRDLAKKRRVHQRSVDLLKSKICLFTIATWLTASEIDQAIMDRFGFKLLLERQIECEKANPKTTRNLRVAKQIL